jgi:hypothetical protein
MLAAAGIKPNELIPVAELAEPLDDEAKFLQALELFRRVFEMWRMGYSGRHTGEISDDFIKSDIASRHSAFLNGLPGLRKRSICAAFPHRATGSTTLSE